MSGKNSMEWEYRYCPQCATPLVRRQAFGKERLVCPNCNFIYFEDPKVAVAGLVTNKDKVLLVRRAVHPQINFWSLPSGFVEAGEMPDQALKREIIEETGLDSNVGELLQIEALSAPHKQGIVLIYSVIASEMAVKPADDISEAAWFSTKTIPWDELAFPSTEKTLRHWLSTLQSSGE